jgi:hypothetical protein
MGTTNSRHCRVSESDWNYSPPPVVHLITNLWNLKMYTTTVKKKRARQSMLDKYFKEK